MPLTIQGLNSQWTLQTYIWHAGGVTQSSPQAAEAQQNPDAQFLGLRNLSLLFLSPQ